jgi:hypothetical protein
MPDSSDKEDEQFELSLSTQPTVETAEEAVPAGRLSDDERLRMLGYDAVLGRALGFWSSSGMTFCYNPILFEFTAYMAIYAYRAPLVFVSSASARRLRRLWGIPCSCCSTSH